MTRTLTVILASGCLLFAFVVSIQLWRGRRAGRTTFAVAGVIELGFVVQAVVGIAMLATTDQDVNGVLFVAYLIGALLVLPAAAWWAWAEESSWGTGVLVVAAIVDAVLLARLTDIWTGRT